VGGEIASFWRFTSAIIVGNTDVDGHAQMLLKLYIYLESKKEKRVQLIMAYFNRRYNLLRFWQCGLYMFRGADKSLARPGRKQATATVRCEFHISYL
jgi:hypothetical protein